MYLLLAEIYTAKLEAGAAQGPWPVGCGASHCWPTYNYSLKENLI
jgi:hypothetical protein